MSALAALTALLLLPGYAISQIAAPNCSSTAWDWTYNSLSQGPCTVAAYLQSTCNGSSFTIYPLQSGQSYGRPTGDNSTNLCMCNTVVYSLMSACDACQGETWGIWSQWVGYCFEILPPSTFPNTVPEGTSVPQWALIDVTVENSWDSDKSMNVGDSPEIGPGGLISNTTNSTGTSPNPTASKAVTPSPSLHTSTSTPSGGGGSHAGVIGGSVVASIAVIAIAAVGIFYLRRRHPMTPPATFPADGELQLKSQPQDKARRPQSHDESRESSPTHGLPRPTMKPYDPDDPTTYPETNMQTSRPRGYHGRPTT